MEPQEYDVSTVLVTAGQTVVQGDKSKEPTDTLASSALGDTLRPESSNRALEKVASDHERFITPISSQFSRPTNTGCTREKENRRSVSANGLSSGAEFGQDVEAQPVNSHLLYMAPTVASECDKSRGIREGAREMERSARSQDEIALHIDIVSSKGPPETGKSSNPHVSCASIETHSHRASLSDYVKAAYKIGAKDQCFSDAVDANDKVSEETGTKGPEHEKAFVALCKRNFDASNCNSSGTRSNVSEGQYAESIAPIVASIVPGLVVATRPESSQSGVSLDRHAQSGSEATAHSSLTAASPQELAQQIQCNLGVVTPVADNVTHGPATPCESFDDTQGLSQTSSLGGVAHDATQLRQQLALLAQQTAAVNMTLGSVSLQHPAQVCGSPGNQALTQGDLFVLPASKFAAEIQQLFEFNVVHTGVPQLFRRKFMELADRLSVKMDTSRCAGGDPVWPCLLLRAGAIKSMKFANSEYHRVLHVGYCKKIAEALRDTRRSENGSDFELSRFFATFPSPLSPDFRKACEVEGVHNTDGLQAEQLQWFLRVARFFSATFGLREGTDFQLLLRPLKPSQAVILTFEEDFTQKDCGDARTQRGQMMSDHEPEDTVGAPCNNGTSSESLSGFLNCLGGASRMFALRNNILCTSNNLSHEETNGGEGFIALYILDGKLLTEEDSFCLSTMFNMIDVTSPVTGQSVREGLFKVNKNASSTVTGAMSTPIDVSQSPLMPLESRARPFSFLDRLDHFKRWMSSVLVHMAKKVSVTHSEEFDRKLVDCLMFRLRVLFAAVQSNDSVADLCELQPIEDDSESCFLEFASWILQEISSVDLSKLPSCLVGINPEASLGSQNSLQDMQQVRTKSRGRMLILLRAIVVTMLRLLVPLYGQGLELLTWWDFMLAADARPNASELRALWGRRDAVSFVTGGTSNLEWSMNSPSLKLFETQLTTTFPYWTAHSFRLVPLCGLLRLLEPYFLARHSIAYLSSQQPAGNSATLRYAPSAGLVVGRSPAIQSSAPLLKGFMSRQSSSSVLDNALALSDMATVLEKENAAEMHVLWLHFYHYFLEIERYPVFELVRQSTDPVFNNPNCGGAIWKSDEVSVARSAESRRTLYHNHAAAPLEHRLMSAIRLGCLHFYFVTAHPLAWKHRTLDRQAVPIFNLSLPFAVSSSSADDSSTVSGIDYVQKSTFQYNPPLAMSFPDVRFVDDMFPAHPDSRMHDLHKLLEVVVGLISELAIRFLFFGIAKDHNFPSPASTKVANIRSPSSSVLRKEDIVRRHQAMIAGINLRVADAFSECCAVFLLLLAQGWRHPHVLGPLGRRGPPSPWNCFLVLLLGSKKPLGINSASIARALVYERLAREVMNKDNKQNFLKLLDPLRQLVSGDIFQRHSTVQLIIRIFLGGKVPSDSEVAHNKDAPTSVGGEIRQAASLSRIDQRRSPSKPQHVQQERLLSWTLERARDTHRLLMTLKSANEREKTEGSHPLSVVFLEDYSSLALEKLEPSRRENSNISHQLVLGSLRQFPYRIEVLNCAILPEAVASAEAVISRCRTEVLTRLGRIMEDLHAKFETHSSFPQYIPLRIPRTTLLWMMREVFTNISALADVSHPVVTDWNKFRAKYCGHIWHCLRTRYDQVWREMFYQYFRVNAKELMSPPEIVFYMSSEDHPTRVTDMTVSKLEGAFLAKLVTVRALLYEFWLQTLTPLLRNQESPEIEHHMACYVEAARFMLEKGALIVSTGDANKVWSLFIERIPYRPGEAAELLEKAEHATSLFVHRFRDALLNVGEVIVRECEPSRSSRQHSTTPVPGQFVLSSNGSWWPETSSEGRQALLSLATQPSWETTDRPLKKRRKQGVPVEYERLPSTSRIGKATPLPGFASAFNSVEGLRGDARSIGTTTFAVDGGRRKHRTTAADQTLDETPGSSSRLWLFNLPFSLKKRLEKASLPVSQVTDTYEQLVERDLMRLRTAEDFPANLRLSRTYKAENGMFPFLEPALSSLPMLLRWRAPIRAPHGLVRRCGVIESGFEFHGSEIEDPLQPLSDFDWRILRSALQCLHDRGVDVLYSARLKQVFHLGEVCTDRCRSSLTATGSDFVRAQSLCGGGTSTRLRRLDGEGDDASEAENEKECLKLREGVGTEASQAWEKSGIEAKRNTIGLHQLWDEKELRDFLDGKFMDCRSDDFSTDLDGERMVTSSQVFDSRHQDRGWDRLASRLIV